MREYKKESESGYLYNIFECDFTIYRDINNS